MHIEDIVGSHHTEFIRLPKHTAADVTVWYPVLKVPAAKAIVVEEVSVYYEDGVTGADTNTNYINVVTKTSTGGAGSEIGNKDFVNGVNAAAGSIGTITLSSTTAITAGYVVGIQYEKVGTGAGAELGDNCVSIKWRFAA